MKSIPRPSGLIGTLVLLMAAVGFLCWINLVRVQHVTFISELTQAAPPATNASSPTGYAGGIRQLIAPEHNNDSYQWLTQTQLMLRNHAWRLRHVDYDNAPNGRAIRSASPYRWWLGLIAGFERKTTGESSVLAVERAALHADPALQILLLSITVIFTAWCFGAAPASLLCAAFATLFPFASAFLPGQPSDYGLSAVIAVWSMLPLLAGVQATTANSPLATGTGSTKVRGTARPWFFVAGVMGGFGLWISVTRQLPVLVGIGLGGVLVASLTRRDVAMKPLPWRAWSMGGASAILAAYFVEYFPANLELLAWRIETVHPLYAAGWLGAGELLVRLNPRSREGRPVWNRRNATAMILALLAIVSVPVVILIKKDHAWLSADPFASHLTNLPDSPVAEGIGAWLVRDHFNSVIAATFAPLLLLAPAAWLLVQRDTAVNHRIALAVASGPLVVAGGLAFFQMRELNFVDAALITLVVAISTALSRGLTRWRWTGLIIVILLPGMLQLLPVFHAASAGSVSATEVESLVERDLAHWLANRVGPDGAIVLAPPGLTTSLYFHGGLRGIATPYADNRDGFAAAVRLSAASSTDEALALIRKRNVSHIVMPSWEPFLDEYARLGSNQPEHTLIGLLHRWLPPRWLRPVPYHLPKIAGFEGQSAVVFEVVEVQDNATALSGLAEYFAEMDQLDQAVAVSRTLEQSFPTDLGAAIAQAQVAIAMRDIAAFNKIVDSIMPRLNEDEAQGLAWDRRVSLAIVLAEAKRKEAARAQVERCFSELDEHLMRSLSPLSLYRLQVLGKAFGLEIAEPTLRHLAPALLPPEMRSAL